MSESPQYQLLSGVRRHITGEHPMSYRSICTSLTLLAAFVITSCSVDGNQRIETRTENATMTYSIQKTEEEWREILTPEQYRVLRGKDTERAFTGEYCSVMEPGIYRCAACDAELFNSETKYKSGTGWPSFWQPVNDSAIEIRKDRSHGMVRDEVLCARCGSHLGHVFSDGPPPTGLRYCLNSISLRLDRQPNSE